MRSSMGLRFRVGLHAVLSAASFGLLAVLALEAFHLARQLPLTVREEGPGMPTARGIMTAPTFMDAVLSYPLLPLVLIFLAVCIFILSGASLLRLVRQISRDLSRSL